LNFKPLKPFNVPASWNNPALPDGMAGKAVFGKIIH
jgi:hypothetical protein